MSSTAPPLSVVVLAAGKGTRMKSRLPKVLQPLAGQPLLHRARQRGRTATSADGDRGWTRRRGCARRVPGGTSDVGAAKPAERYWPRRRRGAGAGGARWRDPAGDWRYAVDPQRNLHALVSLVNEQTFALLTCVVEDVTGYGRIVRNAAGEVVKIVEHKDALAANDHAVLAIHEMNTGIMAAPTAWLRGALARLTPHNAQGELYLTDVIAMAAIDGLRVATAQPDSEMEIAGVNDKINSPRTGAQGAARRGRETHDGGRYPADPARIDVRGTLNCGSDVFIDVGCVFEGAVTLGDNVRIGPNCVLRDASIGTGSVVHPMSHLEGCTVGEGVLIGPFARCAPALRSAMKFTSATSSK